MTLSTRALKVISSVGAVAVCGVSGVIVATDPKPLAAPLRPPVTGSSSTASLVIPPSCGGAGVAVGGGPGALDPSLLPIVQQLSQATTPTERRAILASLTAAKRLEVEAYVRALRQSASGSTASCGTAGSGSMNAGGSIVPSVVDAPPSTHALINTYVS